MLANEIIYSICAIDRRIHEDLELQARAKIAFANTECHEIRHLVEEQQIALELLAMETGSLKALDDVRRPSEELGRRLVAFHKHLMSRVVLENVGPGELLSSIRDSIPELWRGRLGVAYRWPEGLQVGIPGSAEELATATCASSVLTAGMRNRYHDPPDGRSNGISVLSLLHSSTQICLAVAGSSSS